MCVGVCKCVCTLCMPDAHGARRGGIKSPGTGVTEGCELPLDAGNCVPVLKGQPVLLNIFQPEGIFLIGLRNPLCSSRI